MIVLGFDPPMARHGICGVIVLRRVSEERIESVCDYTQHCIGPRHWGGLIADVSERQRVEKIAYLAGPCGDLPRAVLLSVMGEHRPAITSVHCKRREHLERATAMVADGKIDLRLTGRLHEDIDTGKALDQSRVDAFLAALAGLLT